MASEIERKYLVRHDGWRNGTPGMRLRQGYLCTAADRLVRVRRAGERAMLTIKSELTAVHRLEYEYEIPVADAEEMLDRLCERPLVEKTRYALTYGGLPWVVDVFDGVNDGLVLAEVELSSESQAIELPDWAGAEVTHLPRYLNVNLARHPYRDWSEAERTGAP